MVRSWPADWPQLGSAVPCSPVSLQRVQQEEQDLPDGISDRIGLLGRSTLHRSTGARSLGCRTPADDITGHSDGRMARGVSSPRYRKRRQPRNPGSPAAGALGSLESVSERWARRGERAPVEVVRVLLSISYETPVSELHAPPPVLSVPPAAPVAALLFEHALGGFGKGRNALDAALLREGIAARAGQLAVGERNVTGFGERDEPDGAEFQLAPSSADDEPLDPAPGAFGLDVEEQAVAVGVPAGRRGADDDGRERLVGVPASWLGSAGCGGGFDYRASRQRELCNVCKLLIQRCLREQRLACFPQRLPLYGRECTGPSKSTRNPVPSSSEPADCDQVPTPAPAVEGLRDALATPGLAGDRGAQRVVCTRQTFSRRLNGRTGISPAMLLALERIGRSNAAVWGRAGKCCTTWCRTATAGPEWYRTQNHTATRARANWDLRTPDHCWVRYMLRAR